MTNDHLFAYVSGSNRFAKHHTDDATDGDSGTHLDEAALVYWLSVLPELPLADSKKKCISEHLSMHMEQLKAIEASLVPASEIVEVVKEPVLPTVEPVIPQCPYVAPAHIIDLTPKHVVPLEPIFIYTEPAQSTTVGMATQSLNGISICNKVIKNADGTITPIDVNQISNNEAIINNTQEGVENGSV